MKKLTAVQKIIKFFSLIKSNKRAYMFYFIQAGIRGFNPLIHIYFIEKIVKSLSLLNYDLLQKYTTIYILVIIVYEFFWFLSRKVGWVITLAESEKNIYDSYLKSFVQMDNNHVEKLGVGKIIAILENGRQRWGEGLSDSIERGVPLLILLVYVFIVTTKYGILFTLGFFCLLAFSVSILVIVNNYQFIYRKKRSEIRNERLRLIAKILMSKNEILQTNRIESEVKRIEKYCNDMAQINIDMSNGRVIQNRAIPIVIGLSLFAFVFVFGKDVIAGNMELSKFVAITSVFLVVNSSISTFVKFYIDLTKDFTDIEKMWDFFENTPSLDGYNTGKDFVYNKGNIQIKNISYGYYEGSNVFDNFNITLEGGKVTALVGNSGSGKTTLMKLISGYIRANNGEIIIDGQKISDISLKSYYNHVGYLSQEPSVFDGTVLENLTYAINRDVYDDELNDVIKQSGCEFIYSLLQGVNTEIGEKGVKLSGGQRQRLAIAKIMLKNPEIIFLDEPTSALDSFSEELISKAMHNLFKGRTVIIIAHRLQTVKHADNILVFDNGKIVEEGNHSSLIKQHGVYKKMLDLQSGF